MSSSPLDDDEDIFQRLKKHPEVSKSVKEEREKARNAQNEKIRQRFIELVGENSSLPVTISSVRFIGAIQTRRSFLDRILNPLLSVDHDQPYTLREALDKITASTDKLSRLGIFWDPISILIDRPDPTNPYSTPTDIDVIIKAPERGRILAKTGTEVGNVEGAAYGNVMLRNIFGGAESLNLNASYGTRTRNAYAATFETPILSNPDFTLAIDGLKSSNQKPWASHEELLKGFGTRLRWTTPQLSNGMPTWDRRIANTHEVAYSGVWRQITGLATMASPTIKSEIGDSIKSSIIHTWTSDTRDHPYLPSTGRLLKTVNEVAGIGPLLGDVGFLKSEFEASRGTSLPDPFATNNKNSPISGYSLTTGFKAGILYPLPIGLGSTSSPSRINDRFQLGGPTDVRSFRLGGIGPHDGPDALGGDIYAAGSLNLLLPFPYVASSNPIRLQVFLNAGRLVALDQNQNKKGKGKNTWDQDSSGSRDVARSVGSGIKEVFTGGYPSMAAGIGVVYAHPAARFELNFGLPLVCRRGEEVRKGLQFGVGINFL